MSEHLVRDADPRRRTSRQPPEIRVSAVKSRRSDLRKMEDSVVEVVVDSTVFRFLGFLFERGVLGLGRVGAGLGGLVLCLGFDGGGFGAQSGRTRGRGSALLGWMLGLWRRGRVA